MRVTLPTQRRVTSLTFDRTVPRNLVHRASVAEVFLTDSCRVGPGRSMIAAQWPRNHALHHPDVLGHSDPLLLVETFRQAGIYASHRYHEVPLGHRFIFCDLEFHIDDHSPLRVGTAPLNVVLDSKFTLEGPTAKHRIGARFEAEIEVGGRRCARASARMLVVTPRLYAALRSRGQVPAGADVPPQTRSVPLPADQVGRRRPENVLLSADPTTDGTGFRLHLDRDHAAYFEHAGDHVPGIALIEAFRQAGHQMVHRPVAGRTAAPRTPHVLVSSSLVFDRFAELDAPVSITAEHPVDSPHGRLVRIAAAQHGQVLARATTVHRPVAACAVR
ncbi:ScbA/BarX family gamma-butyrolactone biosynthesis protein [Streptomyces sp. NPDC002082]|uniref:ScbA/BarX family gamma-butyrolactone biosynthesis protein n=1 Tax=Streptomyces sp. NPDC002082 TaxID=3154772 RepID=UPI003317245D